MTNQEQRPDGIAAPTDVSWAIDGLYEVCGFASTTSYSADNISMAISVMERLEAENKRLRDERYELAYAITGGEDAPGLLDSVSVEQLVRIARDKDTLHRGDVDRLMQAEAENNRLRKALEKALPHLEANARWHRDAQSQAGKVIDAFAAVDAARAALKGDA